MTLEQRALRPSKSAWIFLAIWQVSLVSIFWILRLKLQLFFFFFYVFIEKMCSQNLIGSRGHSKFKIFCLFALLEPIHVAFVFFWFISKPEIALNSLINVRTCLTDCTSLAMMVVSSANWESFASLLFGSWKPLHSAICLILVARIYYSTFDI